MRASRRHIIAGLAALPAAPALAQSLDPGAFGLRPDAPQDQTAAFLAACEAAVLTGQSVDLSAGTYLIGTVDLPAGLVLRGIPGRTVLRLVAGVIRIMSADNVTLDGIVIEETGSTTPTGEALILVGESSDLTLTRCTIRDSRSGGIGLRDSAARILDCDLYGCDTFAIYSQDGRGILVRGCRISGCGNNGILIWRNEPGRDGSIVTGNTIATIEAKAGGNGQNGNAVNIFRADEVIVADNRMADVAFSAVRINAGRNNQVSDNVCSNCGETAIYVEFGFSGAVVANNIIDGAAAGISMTNLDQGGYLAVCTGNIVRNILARSLSNAEILPVGIFAEADTAISGNVVESVPGTGIAVGWGPHLRNVAVSDNIVHDADIGISVSVAEGAGTATVTDNLISGARTAAIAGTAWTDLVTADLVADAGRYPHVTLSGNRVA